MFDNYINEQPIAVETLKNALEFNKLSHAYLFETNGYDKYYDFILQFVKYIVCEESKNFNHNESLCNVCTSINDNNYIELKIVNPSTLQIKKEEMLSLQDEFKNKPLVGKKKIYIILNAEKLNSSSANTILKFLEEPEDNIIAILVCSSRYKIINTILSRCQIIALNTKKSDNVDIVGKIFQEYYLLDENDDEILNQIQLMVDDTINFIDYYEKHNKDTLLFLNEYFFNHFKDKGIILQVFNIIKIIYYEALKKKTCNEIIYFKNNLEIIELITSKNSIDKIAEKLEVILHTIDKLKYNVNINLALDKFIMEMEEIK